MLIIIFLTLNIVLFVSFDLSGCPASDSLSYFTVIFAPLCTVGAVDAPILPSPRPAYRFADPGDSERLSSLPLWQDGSSPRSDNWYLGLRHAD
jgi:hypothetical protein